MVRVRLSHASGAEAMATRTGTPAIFAHFFDLVGARPGDRFTLHMTKDSTGSNPNVAHVGLLFDR